MQKRLLISLLLSIVVTGVALYFFWLWDSAGNREISSHMYFAMGLGVFFTCAISAGFSILAYVSTHRGHDEDAQQKQTGIEGDD